MGTPSRPSPDLGTRVPSCDMPVSLWREKSLPLRSNRTSPSALCPLIWGLLAFLCPFHTIIWKSPGSDVRKKNIWMSKGFSDHPSTFYSEHQRRSSIQVIPKRQKQQQQQKPRTNYTWMASISSEASDWKENPLIFRQVTRCLMKLEVSHTLSRLKVH